LAAQLSHRLSIVSHEQSGGKARRLNELACTLTSEFLLVLDADHWVEPDIVKRMLDRFDEGADVACVQIASAVRNADTNLLTRALEMEYLCRCQGIYPGKGMGIFVGSGGMFRRTELLLAGGFDASMLTEDVELSYRLYKSGKRVVYEHRLCSHELATTDFRNFFNQRHRWMRGLWQAMLHHVWETGTHPSFRRARPYFVQFTCDGLGALCLSVLQAYSFLHLLGWLHFELFLPIYVMLVSCSFAFGVGFLRGNRLRNVLYLPIVPLYMIMHNIPMCWALIDSYVFGTAVTWVKTERVSESPPSLRSRRRRA
jgi:biofilm PGA synthesis N-glycosyltransferase PgaC